MSDSRRGFRFAPIERRALLGPLRGGQALIVAVAFGAAILLLDSTPGVSALLGGLLLVSAAVGVTVLPVAGRSIEQWLPVALEHLWRVGSGRAHWTSKLPMAGFSLGGRLDGAGQESLPAVGKVRVIQIESAGRRLGALSENRGRRLTSVLVCRGTSFALLDVEAQERRLAQWGLVLASLAGTRVRRVQWIERTAPARGDELARWLHEARDPSLPLRGAPLVESYLELIGASARVAQDHEVLVAIQVDTSRGVTTTLEECLADETLRLATALENAEIPVIGALGRSHLTRLLRTAYDPFARSELAALDAVSDRAWSMPSHEAGPIGMQESWSHLRCDGACHATFWVGSWPRSEVAPMFMDALLGSSATVRTVAVTFEPVPPDRSTREVEAAITRDRADSELRRRFGQSETARHRQARDAASAREAELAAGHTEVRLAGFVTVSGRDTADLERACAQVHQQAARSRIVLHRMYGQQAQAFGFTLPLARGLR